MKNANFHTIFQKYYKSEKLFLCIILKMQYFSKMCALICKFQRDRFTMTVPAATSSTSIRRRISKADVKIRDISRSHKELR